jgi:hypothetical protein
MRLSNPALWKLSAAFALTAFSSVGVAAQSGTIQFKSMEVLVKESVALARINLQRVGGSEGTVTVEFATMDGIATAGEDYRGTNGTLTFGPGVTSLFFNVPIINDTKNEVSETVTIELSNPSEGASLGSANATLTITDNDPCAFALATTKRTHSREAAVDTVTVTATDGCAWTAESNTDWIAIISGGGPGSGEVSYSLDANPTGRPRVGTLLIAGKTFTVTQQGLFVPLLGNYTGLIQEETVLHHESSGILNARVTDLGAFSAKMILSGKRHSFSGNFAPDGRATNSIPRPGMNAVTVLLSLDLYGAGPITGQINDGNWVSLVTLDRAVYNKTDNQAPQAGRYTLLIAGDEGSATAEPGGDSFGTVTVDVSGNIKVNATLADGTKATQAVSLSPEGVWPLYIPLYGGKGFVLSKVAFGDIPGESDFAGTLTWSKPALATSKFYPDGFATQPPIIGSRYQSPTNNTDRLLDLGAGAVQFTAGNLAESFEHSIELGDDNKVSTPGPNKLILTIVQPTGLFKGTVVAPGTSRSVPFKGALFQKGNYGGGFFLGTDQSGRVWLGDPP